MTRRPSLTTMLRQYKRATTATHLARMEGEEDNGWQGVAQALGVA